MRNEPKYRKRDGSLSLQGYGWLGKEFQRFLDHCIYVLDKHIVIVFHTVEDKDGDDTKLRIKAEGSSKNSVWEVMDLGLDATDIEMNIVRQNLSPFETIVIDTGGKLLSRSWLPEPPTTS